jgi:uncharacterized protein YndB with AHSA1/START domain
MADIRHQIAIEAPPEEVYAALATQAGLRSWWTADTIADHKTGGKAEFGFDQHSMVFRMTIERLDPNRQVIWDCHGDNPEWVGTTLTWTISPAWRQPAALHAKRMEGHDRHGRDLQFDLGRADVPAQGLRRRQKSRPHWRE